VGQNAQQAIEGIPNFTRINLSALEESDVDWQKLRDGLYGTSARKEPKKPLDHQRDAIAAAHKHFIEDGKARGKLIMACGTGKTFTSLKIAEDITPSDGFVLFLVPSIALLGQSLNAWMSDKSEEMYAICVCSDPKASRSTESDDAIEHTRDLAVPASTSTQAILRQLRRYEQSGARTVIFSTYQSIEAVEAALKAYGRRLDLVVCDEAHRTTGAFKEDCRGSEQSPFTIVHEDARIPARHRLYMTATPRVYGEGAKSKAAREDYVLCSMDDARTYGEEFYRISFYEAVERKLLCDYKVLVLTVNENDIPREIHEQINHGRFGSTEPEPERLENRPARTLEFDDATKLIGCLNALSKRISGDHDVTREQDPGLMKRAVAFCQTINPTAANPKFSSKQIAHYFPQLSQAYRDAQPDADAIVQAEARHIDGSMDAATRAELINWLKEDTPEGRCRILCNVRCLSEGVDVPALDAVLFLSARKSEVEVVQSVGRVMRSFGRGTEHEKRYGYIIIPLIVPEDVAPEDALSRNATFEVVWQILNALRSHDDRFNATVNQISLNQERPARIVIGGVPRGTGSFGAVPSGGNPLVDKGQTLLDDEEAKRQLELRFGELQDGIYAKLVEKVGDRLYWEHWAASIGDIALKFVERINRMVEESPVVREELKSFVESLQKNLNPSISEDQVVEMLAQHKIAQPIFDALFNQYDLKHNNPISVSMQRMLDLLDTEGFSMDTRVLERFYQSVRVNVQGIDNLAGKQRIIKDLFEKFFKGAFPKTVQQLGIVYTPIECVDFIVRSTDSLLRREFNTALTREDVHILDPFVGTGTFITRLLQSGLIRPEDMRRKYRSEIHCNEIVLLAYYIADVNIEAVYNDLVRPDAYEYYDGICLADTFQLAEPAQTSLVRHVVPAQFRTGRGAHAPAHSRHHGQSALFRRTKEWQRQRPKPSLPRPRCPRGRHLCGRIGGATQ